MLILISPAKTLDYQSPLATERYTQPELLDYSQQLIHEARKLSAPQIASLMSISDKLADLNATRFHEWQPDFTPANARQALLAFKGDVYTGLQAETFSEADFDFAQQHLRMLSGLYGVLRPLDLMQPYRLEMGIRLENAKGKDLYQFWGDVITDKLNAALQAQGDNVVINLASDEYFKSVKPKKLDADIIKPVFLDEKNGKFKVISFYAKKARGLMSRFIIQNRLTKPEQLTGFNSEGYFFDEASSGKNELVFKRHEQKKTTPPAGGVCVNGASGPGPGGARHDGGDRHDRDVHRADASGYRASHSVLSTSHGRASGRHPSSARYYPDRQFAVLPRARG